MVSSRTASRAALVAVILSALPLLAAFVVPFYSGTSSDGRTSHETLVQVNGARVLLVLAIPVVVAVVGLIAAQSGVLSPLLIAMCVLMWGFSLLGALTVGVLYLPADIALLVAATAAPSRPRRVGAFAPPGWYPDPSSAASQLRWWDGNTWTASVTART